MVTIENLINNAGRPSCVCYACEETFHQDRVENNSLPVYSFDVHRRSNTTIERGCRFSFDIARQTDCRSSFLELDIAGKILPGNGTARQFSRRNERGDRQTVILNVHSSRTPESCRQLAFTYGFFPRVDCNRSHSRTHLQ